MSSQTFDTYYDSYWTPQGFNPTGYIKLELAELFTRYLKPGMLCLDVGCGDGQTSGPWLIRAGCRYTGVDISRPAVEAAVASGLTAIQVADTNALPFPDNHFDHVLCIEVLEHVFAPQKTVQEIRRVLKPGGTFLLTVPNVAYWRRRLELLIGRWNPLGDQKAVSEPWRDPHIRFFTPPILGALLTHCGFSRIKTGGHAGGLVRDLPWVGRKLTLRGGSRLYRAFQSLFPTLLGYGAYAVGTK